MKSLLLTIAALCLCICAKATTFSVTNTNDDGGGSLRSALTAALADVEGRPHIINIDLTPGTIIEVTSTHAFSGDNIPLPINALPNLVSTTLNGNGVVLKAMGNRGRFFQIQDATVNNLILDGGVGHTTSGSIFASGTNVLNQCMILNSLAGVVNPGVGAGGAMRINGGTTTLNQCTLRNNTASKGSALWIQPDATLNLNNCTIADNMVVTPSEDITAASIFLEGTLNMVNNIIANSLPEGAVDLFDSGNTIETNTGNLIENFVCGGASCMDETFASTEDPGIVPDNSADPYFVFMIPSGSEAATIGAGATMAPAAIASVSTVPTLGEWGLIVLSIILLIVGVVTIKERDLALA